jgi:outer membrane protein
MKIRTYVLAVIFIFAALSTAFGEEAVNPLMVGSPLTLEESIEIALEKNPTLKGAQGAIKEAKYRRLGAVSDFLPQVDTQYSYTRLDEAPTYTTPASSFYIPPPVDTTVTIPAHEMQVGNRDFYTWQSSVTQPVFTGGALTNNYLLADLGVDMARVEFERTKLDLILNVKEAYYGVLTAEKGVEVAEQTVEQLESNLNMAQAFFDVGMTAKNDLLQVEVSMAQARQYLITAQNGLEVARAAFNTLLRRDINEDVNLVEILEYVPTVVDVDRLTEEAYQERPEIKAAGLGIKSAKRGVGLAASGLFPQASIVFNYERQGDDYRVNGSRFEPDPDSWSVMGVARWKVWDWGKTVWGVGESKAKVFQAECALEEIMDGVRLDVKQASLSVIEAEKNIQVAETAVSQAEENFRINEERYKGQVATSTDVLDALTLLVQAKTNYYRALSDYNIAKARLARATGGR